MSESRIDSVALQLGDLLKVDRIKAWVVARPTRIFWTFAITHLVLWTIVPAITSPNAPLDVIEGYAWGHEWPLGTYKHPPMQAWWLGALAILTDRASWIHFLASQIAIVTAFWAVWQTGRRMFSEQGALLGVLLLEGVIYYNFEGHEFNPNVLQLPFWALIGLFFHRAIKDDRITDWLFFGLWSACGLYTKYSTALLLVTLALLTLVRPEGRRLLKTPGPYVAAAFAFLLFLPHMIWLVDHAFLPFAYARERMQNFPNTSFITSSVRAPLFYIGSQLLALLPATLLFLAFFDHGAVPQDKRIRSFDKDFLDFVTFGPFILTLFMAVIVGIRIRDMWAMPFWNFVGLWAIAHFRAEFSGRALRRFAYSWSVIFIAALLGVAGQNILSAYATHQALRTQFPGKALAERVDAAWHERFNRPLRYVIGDTWPAGNIAYYTPEWPHVLQKGDYRLSPWIRPDAVRRSGGVLVWCLRNCAVRNSQEQAPPFLSNFPLAEIQDPITLPRQTDADVEPTTIGWAILAPADSGEH